MKVRIFVGAEYAYACITTNSKSLDVRLEHGKSAAQSLADSADDLRVQASRLLERAGLLDAAAVLI